MSDAPVDASSARARATVGNEASTSDDRILNLGESRDFVSELRDFKTVPSPVKTRISAHVRSDSTCSTDGCVLRDRGRGNERARARRFRRVGWTRAASTARELSMRTETDRAAVFFRCRLIAPENDDLERGERTLSDGSPARGDARGTNGARERFVDSLRRSNVRTMLAMALIILLVVLSAISLKTLRKG